FRRAYPSNAASTLPKPGSDPPSIPGFISVFNIRLLFSTGARLPPPPLKRRGFRRDEIGDVSPQRERDGPARRPGRVRPGGIGVTGMCEVEPSSGRVLLHEPDFRLNGELPFVLARRYNNLSDDTGILGPGWTLDLDRRIEGPPDGLVLVDEE